MGQIKYYGNYLFSSFARNINLPSTNKNMDYIYHECALKHRNSTNIIIGSNEKCLTPTSKCFSKDLNDVINAVRAGSQLKKSTNSALKNFRSLF